LTDFANPQLLHRLDIGGWETSSIAQFEAKAFLYYAPKELLAIPIYALSEYLSESPQSYMDVWHVTVESGFDEIGKVDHSDLTPEEGSDEIYGAPYVYRGVIVGDYIFTLSDAAIVVTSLDPFEDVATLPVPYKYYDQGYGDDDSTEPGGPPSDGA
jgi:hypothetical protein